MGSLNVRRVQSRRDLNAFIKLPFRLHRGTPWVPPLLMERREFLNRDKNPFFEHAEAEYFLAERDGEVVGRITAQVDERWTQFQGGNDGMFGFFESENDPEVAGALVETAAEWLRARGRDRMLGPMDFTTNDECGLLVEGYDLEPLVLEPWHPPYYRELLEGLGMTKAMDLLMWRLAMGELKQGDQFHDFIHQAAAGVGQRARRGRPPHEKARPGGRGRPGSWRSTTRPGARTGASCRSPRRRCASRPRT